MAPAIAVGCPFVMKPASRTPLGALIMGEVLAECDVLPEGAFSILPAHRDGADLFTEDDRLKLLSFTGSPGVGWDLKAKAGKKNVFSGRILEIEGLPDLKIEQAFELSDASAERSARALRPEFKAGMVKVVKGFCPNHRIGQ